MQTVLAVDPELRWPRKLSSESMQRAGIFAVSLTCALVVWAFLAWSVGKPAFLPSPIKTLEGAVELVRNGELQADVAASFARIMVGFILGTMIGIPLGLLDTRQLAQVLLPRLTVVVGVEPDVGPGVALLEQRPRRSPVGRRHVAEALSYRKVTAGAEA